MERLVWVFGALMAVSGGWEKSGAGAKENDAVAQAAMFGEEKDGSWMLDKRIFAGELAVVFTSVLLL